MAGDGIRGRAAAARALRAVAAEAAGCTRCALYAKATQTVFGAGPVPAPLMLVGEQPGDREDHVGEPFVGPAGRILDEALAAAGIDRATAYVTNAVKHFKWQLRGKRRIHQRPDTGEVAACSHWLSEELAAVDPAVVVALGAVAVRALFGRPLAVAALRGQVQELPVGRPAVVTLHPAAIVRIQDAGERRHALDGVVADLRRAAEVIGGTRR